MHLDFIKNISESKIFNNKEEIEATSHSKLSELLMAYTLGLHVICFENVNIQDYVGQTLLFESFASYRQSDNDLYLLVNALVERSEKFNSGLYRVFLYNIHEGKDNTQFVKNYFLRLENELNVESSLLKGCRRAIAHYENLNNKDKMQVLESLIEVIGESNRKPQMIGLLEGVAMRIAEILNEEITSQELKVLEKYLDRLFAENEIDFAFTRHFLERANDPRNAKPITLPELSKMFSDAQKKYGKQIAKLGHGAEAVISDIKSDINAPFLLKFNSETRMLELIAKTVMRKKGFKTSNKKFVTY